MEKIKGILGLCSCKKKKEKDEGETIQRRKFHPEGVTEKDSLIIPKEGPFGRDQSNPEEPRHRGRISEGETLTNASTVEEKIPSSQKQTELTELETEQDRDLKFLMEAIERSNINQLLNEALETVTGMAPDPPFAKISSPKDPLELYFQVGDHPNPKEKFHKFLSSYTANFEPKTFVLRQCMLCEEDRLKSNSALQSYKVLLRRRIGDTYYMINHAIFKKVLLFAEKDSLCIKAVRFLENGDCIEQNISFEHDQVPKSRERIQVISNPIYYRKTETGLSTKSFNFVLPKTSIGFSILKPIMNKSYNDTFKALLERLNTSEPLSLEELIAQFKQ